MDPRLEHRRRRVAEDRARSNLGRLMRILIVLAVVAALVWLGQSPFLSVSVVTVTGAARVDVAATLAANEVVAGRPMLLLDVDGAEQDLLADPWVAEAEVARDWPTTVIVRVVERIPAATVRLSDGWHLMAADGTVLAPAAGPQPELGVAQFDSVDSGAAGTDLEVVGAVEFLAALPEARQRRAVVTLGVDGLEAVLDDFTVRLGRPFDMAEKADVATALIESGLEAGAVITVVAPASPAVLPPGADTSIDDGDEGEETGPSTSTP